MNRRKKHPGEVAAELRASGKSWPEIAHILRMPRKKAYNYWHSWSHKSERRQWYQDHAEAHKAQVAAYREANRDSINAKKRHTADVAKRRAAVIKRSLIKHAPAARERAIAWREANRALLRQGYKDRWRRDIEASRLAHRIRNSIRRYGDEWGPVHRVALDLRAACQRLDDESQRGSSGNGTTDSERAQTTVMAGVSRRPRRTDDHGDG